MFDFIRNLTKSEAERRQEMLSAYLDNALTPGERAAFEEQLRSDSALRASLEQQRRVKENISQLPRLRAPRNFTLDPAAYGRPAPQPSFKLYPIMRTATALAAIMLIFLFSLELFTTTNEQTIGTAEESSAVADRGLEEAGDSGVASEAAAGGVGLAPAAEAPVEEPLAAEAEEAMGEVVVEEAAEEEMMEEEAAAEEPAAEEAPAQEPQAVSTFDGDLFGINGGAESYPAPASPAGGETANVSPTATIAASEQAPLPPTEGEGDAGTADIDGSIPTPAPEPTGGPSLTPPAAAGFDNANNQFNLNTSETAVTPVTGVTTATQEEAIGSNANTQTEPQPSSPLRYLQIGLGILFVLLLAATLYLRRQL